MSRPKKNEEIATINDDGDLQDEGVVIHDQRKDKKKNVSNELIQDFHRDYSDQFLELIMIPMIAFCRVRYETVPYEFCDRAIRFRRNENDVNRALSTNLRRLALYCFRKRIDKSLLMTVAGGNLYGYYLYKLQFVNKQ